MKKNKAWLTVVGFLLAGTGFLAIILSLVGLQFTFLAWLDDMGRLLGFVLKVAMVLVGFILMYIAQLDTEDA
jgi:hypothetical protein